MVDDLVQHIAAQVDRPARPARLTVADDGSLTYVTSESGMQLDRATSRAAIAQAVTNGDAQVSLTAQPVQPEVATDQITAARDQLQGILSQPIQITAANYSRTLSTDDILPLVSLTDPTPGQPATVSVNNDALQPLLDDAAKAVNQPASNARFSWDGKNLGVTRESQPGQGLDEDKARDILSTQILAGAHAINLPVTTTAPAVNSADASKLKIHELIDREHDLLRGFDAREGAQHQARGAAPERRGRRRPGRRSRSTTRSARRHSTLASSGASA